MARNSLVENKAHVILCNQQCFPSKDSWLRTWNSGNFVAKKKKCIYTWRGQHTNRWSFAENTHHVGLRALFLWSISSKSQSSVCGTAFCETSILVVLLLNPQKKQLFKKDINCDTCYVVSIVFKRGNDPGHVEIKIILGHYETRSSKLKKEEKNLGLGQNHWKSDFAKKINSSSKSSWWILFINF